MRVDGLGGQLAVLHGLYGEVLTLVAGFASREDGRAMEPQDLLLSGSVGKTYVTAAAHHLVAAGKLDLHEDVNTGLEGFRIDEAFAEPITLHHLLTHTAGIGYGIDVFAKTPRRQAAGSPGAHR